MKALHQTSFVESLMIQVRVVGALLMREIITRYGRNNIGFLWLFVEPLLLTLVIVLLWKFLRADRVSSLNIIAFVITGYPMAMMWRNVSNRAIGAIAANASLLYHRNVRVLDTIFARMLLEIAGATIAQIVIMAVLIAIEIFHNIILYVEDNHNRQLAVEIVLGTALMAIARKIIVLDFNEVSAAHAYATAAVTLALSIGYYLIVIRPKRTKRQILVSTPTSSNG